MKFIPQCVMLILVCPFLFFGCVFMECAKFFSLLAGVKWDWDIRPGSESFEDSGSVDMKA